MSLDVSRDREISADELKGTSKTLAKLDTSQNGQLDPSELAGSDETRPKPQSNAKDDCLGDPCASFNLA